MSHSSSFVLPLEIFSVFEFSLGAVPTGVPLPSVRNLGDFHSIETAFHNARDHAIREARFCAALPPPEETSGGSRFAPISVVSTEFGYDVCRGLRVVARFWIGSRPASAGA